MHLNRKIARRPLEEDSTSEVESVTNQVLGARGLYEDWRLNKTPEERGMKPQDAQFLLGRMSKYHVIEMALRHIATENYADAVAAMKKASEDLTEAIRLLDV